MKNLFSFVFLLTLCLINNVGHSQDSLKLKPAFSYGLSGHYGFIVPHSEDVARAGNSFPRGMKASLSWHHTDQQTINRYGCFPRHSLSFAFYDFDNPLFGKAVSVAYSLEPHLMWSDRLSFYPRISIGSAILSNPFDPVDNPTNKSYSLPVSAYLAIGVGFHWQFSKQWATRLNADYNHVSNGAWREPNLGLNWPTFAIGVEYSPKGIDLKKMKREKEDLHHKALRMDLEIFGLVKDGIVNAIEKYDPVIGINFAMSKQISRLHTWTAAAEFYQDQLLQRQLASNMISSDGLRAGILVGHEFLLEKFIFSQQFGMYVAGQYDTDLFYQRWGLQYYFLPRWRIGVNLRARKHLADFTDIRIAYVIGTK
jgi:Lipid A 3-O-deacylase (PagL)